ncbi:MAG: hypothetical protein CMK92_03775, partial [Pseudomonas sp.]|nr:hypothetical protein [Pseudomonas sp.]
MSIIFVSVLLVVAAITFGVIFGIKDEDNAVDTFTVPTSTPLPTPTDPFDPPEFKYDASDFTLTEVLSVNNFTLERFGSSIDNRQFVASATDNSTGERNVLMFQRVRGTYDEFTLTSAVPLDTTDSISTINVRNDFPSGASGNAVVAVQHAGSSELIFFRWRNFVEFERTVSTSGPYLDPSNTSLGLSIDNDVVNGLTFFYANSSKDSYGEIHKYTAGG